MILSNRQNKHEKTFRQWNDLDAALENHMNEIFWIIMILVQKGLDKWGDKIIVEARTLETF